jgi:hypothetical protein
MSALLTEHCACSGCTCTFDPEDAVPRNGKLWCSSACADLHPQGAPCPDEGCHCEQGSQSQERTISDSQLDEAVEETFPASDPISP